MAVVRTEPQAIGWLRDRVGSTTITAEDGVPITVDGHCAGIAARAHTGRPAGYDFARDIAKACGEAGVLHNGNAPDGVCHLWLGGPGHIATQSRPGKVICNVGPRLLEAPLSYWGGMQYVGWVHAVDVPGWGPLKPLIAPPPVKSFVTVGGHTPVTATQVAQLLGIGRARLLWFNPRLALTRAKPGSVVVVPPGVKPVPIHAGP